MPFDPNLIQSDLSIGDVQFALESPTLVSFGPDTDIVQAVDEYMTRNGTIQAFRFPTETPPLWFQLSFSEYSRNNLFEVNAKLNTDQNIILPLPREIQEIHSVGYDEEAIGMPLGLGINQYMNQNGKNASATSLNIDSVAGSAGAAWGAQAGARVIDATTQGLQIGSPIAAAKGVFGFSPNQFFTVLLRAPIYKDLSFTWKLMPKTYQESEECRRIIQTINNAMSPGLALGGAIFSFPKVVRCAFMPNYAHLFRFKPAVITDVFWNYSPGGSPAFFNAPTGEYPPESYEFEIRFRELEYWLKSDFKDKEAGPDDTTGNDRFGWKWEQKARDFLGVPQQPRPGIK